MGEAAISCDAPGVHRAHCVITLLTPQWDTCSVLLPNCPIRDFNILFCFVLTLSVRMLVMMAMAWCLDLRVREILILPSSPLLLSGLSFWQAADYHRRAGKSCLGTKMEGTRVEDCRGGYSKAWCQLADMLQVFEVCLLLTLLAP